MADTTRFVRDPVCGMTIPVESALVVDHRGSDYYFCESVCAETFSDEPERWIPPIDRAVSIEAPWPAPRPRRPEHGPRKVPSYGP